MKRVGLVRSHISRRQGSRPAAPVEAASQAPNPAVFDDGKQGKCELESLVLDYSGLVERTLNAAGKWYYQNIQPFNFAQHHEGQTGNRLDHTSVSMEANCTTSPQKLIQDKHAKLFTVEGLPGAGKADFTSGIAAGAGLKDMGKGDLMWELNRLRDFKGENNLYNTWKMLIDVRLFSNESFLFKPRRDTTTWPCEASTCRSSMRIQRIMCTLAECRIT
jgi:hypothetical protein